MAMTWARRLKRVFDIDIETCGQCGGAVKIIASIEEPAVIRKILAHPEAKSSSAGTSLLPESRGHGKQAYSGKFITPTICCSDPSGTVAFVLQTGFGLK